MAPEELETQKAADADETEAAERYRRGQRLTDLLTEAIRRDEARVRLELRLRIDGAHS